VVLVNNSTPLSTNRTTISHFKPLNTKKTRLIALEIQLLAWNRLNNALEYKYINVLVLCCSVCVKTISDSSLLQTVFLRASCFIYAVYLLTYSGVQHAFYVTWCLRRLTVTRRLSKVEQKLLTLPEHLCSHSVLSEIHIAQSLVFCVVFFCSNSLAILLAVLRLTDSDYPIDTFKPFLSKYTFMLR
jgi:hypothetical protein